MANWRERLQELWNRYQNQRKYIIIGAIVVLVLAFAGISYWYGSKPEYVPLYTNLETKDAGDVVNSLKEAGVPYELLEDKKGATILVPATQVHNLRLDLASAGLPRGNKGFELFDDSKLGVTEFQNKVNYLQALQGELTRTIEHLDSVDKARVHIVLPEDSLYKKNEKPATASILLMLKPETKLTTPEVKGMVNLVSHSVQGLAPENITIVDEQGNILNKNDDDEFEKQTAQNLRTLSQIEMTKKVRDHIQQNIQTMLDKTLGEGNAFVRVSVELDFDDRKIDRQTFTPVVDESGIIRSQQDISESYNGESTMPGGPAGVQSNIPGYVAEDRNANARKESTKNYEVNEENQKIIASPGSIRRLTVAVLVNDTITELQQEGLLRAVSSAAGINEERGDTISVEPLPFNTALEDQKAEEARQEQLRKDRILYTEIAAMILIAALLLGGFLMYRWKKRKERQDEIERQLAAERKAREEEEQARRAEEARVQAEIAQQEAQRVAEEQAQAEQRAKDIEEDLIEEDNLTEEEKQQLQEKKAILKLIDEKPAEVAMLVKLWLTEDE